MNCNLIRDLIPLYIDGCCSEESAAAVREHIEQCSSCRALLEEMKEPASAVELPPAPKSFHRINDWKASVMQSVLLFLAFSLITLGVAWEARTGNGDFNGFWAFNLVVPATGFLLSLTNWYFLRLYKSRKSFSTCSMLTTLGAILCAFLWSCIHYEIDLLELLVAAVTTPEIIGSLLLLGGLGTTLTIVFAVMAKVLSDRYAKMLGKE